ncbi:hypothetical protein [Microbacterium sp. LWO13-1.2]
MMLADNNKATAARPPTLWYIAMRRRRELVNDSRRIDELAAVQP